MIKQTENNYQMNNEVDVEILEKFKQRNKQTILNLEYQNNFCSPTFAQIDSFIGNNGQSQKIFTFNQDYYEKHVKSYMSNPLNNLKIKFLGKDQQSYKYLQTRNTIIQGKKFTFQENSNNQLASNFQSNLRKSIIPVELPFKNTMVPSRMSSNQSDSNFQSNLRKSIIPVELPFKNTMVPSRMSSNQSDSNFQSNLRKSIIPVELPFKNTMVPSRMSSNQSDSNFQSNLRKSIIPVELPFKNTMVPSRMSSNQSDSNFQSNLRKSIIPVELPFKNTMVPSRMSSNQSDSNFQSNLRKSIIPVELPFKNTMVPSRMSSNQSDSNFQSNLRKSIIPVELPFKNTMVPSRMSSNQSTSNFNNTLLKKSNPQSTTIFKKRTMNHSNYNQLGSLVPSIYDTSKIIRIESNFINRKESNQNQIFQQNFNDDQYFQLNLEDYYSVIYSYPTLSQWMKYVTSKYYRVTKQNDIKYNRLSLICMKKDCKQSNNQINNKRRKYFYDTLTGQKLKKFQKAKQLQKYQGEALQTFYQEFRRNQLNQLFWEKCYERRYYRLKQKYLEKKYQIQQAQKKKKEEITQKLERSKSKFSEQMFLQYKNNTSFLKQWANIKLTNRFLKLYDSKFQKPYLYKNIMSYYFEQLENQKMKKPKQIQQSRQMHEYESDYKIKNLEIAKLRIKDKKEKENQQWKQSLEKGITLFESFQKINQKSEKRSQKGQKLEEIKIRLRKSIENVTKSTENIKEKQKEKYADLKLRIQEAMKIPYIKIEKLQAQLLKKRKQAQKKLMYLDRCMHIQNFYLKVQSNSNKIIKQKMKC